MEKELLHVRNIIKAAAGVEPFLSVFRTIIQNLMLLKLQKGMTVA
jgi:hypothetical protein